MPLDCRTRFLTALASCCCLLALDHSLLSHELRAASFRADSVVLFQAGGVDTDTAFSASPISVSSSVSNSNGTGESHSVAEQGFLRLSGFISATGSKGTSGTLNGMFIEFNDVVIRKSDGSPSNVDVAATFRYFTSFDAAWSGPISAASIGSRSDVTISSQISQPGFGTFAETDQYSKSYTAGSTGAAGLETLAATIRTDTPFSLRLAFGVGGLSASTGNFGQYDLSANVGPVLGAFASEGGGAIAGGANAVFLLPEGFTADSAEMGLVDNRWQGIVPEPASLTLLAIGLSAIGRRHRVS